MVDAIQSDTTFSPGWRESTGLLPAPICSTCFGEYSTVWSNDPDGHPDCITNGWYRCAWKSHSTRIQLSHQLADWCLTLVRILYRVRQFWRMVWIKPDRYELEQVQAILSPGQWELFTHMQPGDKEHAVTVYHRLIQNGETQPDLLIAALLHDVGKVRYRMNPFQRTMVVLARAIIPEKAHQWGKLSPETCQNAPGWKKPFVVAEQHAAWGAEMAHAVGVSSLTETLIREHHQGNSQGMSDEVRYLLKKLWIVDNEN